MLGPTAHTDTFARDNLPPPDEWPDFLLDGFDYPEHLNAGVELTIREPGAAGQRREAGKLIGIARSGRLVVPQQ